jgi:hypothetical protein
MKSQAFEGAGDSETGANGTPLEPTSLLFGESEEKNRQVRLCPCCQQELLPGLFERERVVPEPAQRVLLRQSGDIFEEHFYGSLLVIYNRFFVQARISLPVYWEDSPVKCRLWVELSGPDATEILSALEGRRGLYRAVGRLANDIGGFVGSLGSEAIVEARPGEELSRIVSVSDERILNLGSEERLSHESLATLYRRLHGGRGYVAPADQALRKSVREHIKTHIGGYWIEREVMAPAHLAGIVPPILMIRPPHDTGDELVLATVGNSEDTLGGKRYELLTVSRSQSQRFEHSFQEFCYLSRHIDDDVVIDDGSLIPELGGQIPGTLMCAWLAVTHLRLASGKEIVPEPLDFYPFTVDFRVVIPITRSEMSFCQIYGGRRLQEMLFDSGVDLTDPRRESVL